MSIANDDEGKTEPQIRKRGYDCAIPVTWPQCTSRHEPSLADVVVVESDTKPKTCRQGLTCQTCCHLRSRPAQAMPVRRLTMSKPECDQRKLA